MSRISGAAAPVVKPEPAPEPLAPVSWQTGAAPALGRQGARRDAGRTAPLTPAPLSERTRTFSRVQGEQLNAILVAPEAQSHVVVDNHPLKRNVALSQPSGNAGAAFWWSSDTVKSFELAAPPEVVTRGELRGSRVTLVADAEGTVRFEAPILDSVRAIRDRLADGKDARVALRKEGARQGLVPQPAIEPRVIESGPAHVILERSSISGSHRHRLELRGQDGTTIQVGKNGELSASASGGRAAVSVTYLTDLAPLTPFAPLELLEPRARERLTRAVDRAERGGLDAASTAELKLVTRALEDLSSMVFHEKALAGGWRFLTYFGRDTLQTITMLRPILDPEVVESVFQAALERLGENGAVAHEEDLADQAEHVRLSQALAGGSTIPRQQWSEPIYDYKMADDDFMLASALCEYLADPAVAADRKRAFLEKTGAAGQTNLELLGKNLQLALELAEPYASSVQAGQPDPTKLIKIRDDEMVGDWRDSPVGLALGRYPASINLELVGTTFEKAEQMLRALDTLGLSGENLPRPEKLAELSDAWASAREHYRVEIPAAELPALMQRFLDGQPDEASRAYFRQVDLGGGVTTGDVAQGKKLPEAAREGWRFSAVSLDAAGKPIPVMSSDGLFGLTGSSARKDAVEEVTRLFTTPYPLGLATPAGLLITNPALSNDAQLDELMGPGRYHGTVIWTWLEALGVAALSHQRSVARRSGDLTALRAADQALQSLDRQVAGSGELQTSELHGFAIRGHDLVATPFEGSAGESLEAWPGNATQLWATALPLARWAKRERLI